MLRVLVLAISIAGACSLPIHATEHVPLLPARPKACVRGAFVGLRGGAVASIRVASVVRTDSEPELLDGQKFNLYAFTKIVTCVALIASSAIGGSFLALPMTTRPLGFMP